MTGNVLQSVWPILLLLGYVLVTCVFTVLGYTRKRAIDVHNRVRECMELRRVYLTGKARSKQSE